MYGMLSSEDEQQRDSWSRMQEEKKKIPWKCNGIFNKKLLFIMLHEQV